MPEIPSLDGERDAGESPAPPGDGTPALPEAGPDILSGLVSPGRADLFAGIGLPSYSEQASFRVRTEGEAAHASLAAAARANTTGPEARLRERIRGEMDRALRSIREDEAAARALPFGSAEREAIERRIDAREALFRSELRIATLETAREVAARSGGERGALDRFKSILPGYLRECVDREGIVVPGVPGAFRPRADDGVLRGPTGIDWKGHF
jgi:hypothetical protein